jgi:ABC-type transport system involved in multi-copper enzyme maturation permease subunit
MLFSRLANLSLLILTGLPVLTLLSFLGGVNPEQVIAGFIGVGALLLSLGSLSILMSVFNRTALGALVSSYFWTVFLFLPSSCVMVGSLAATGETLLAVIIVHLVIHGVITVVCCAWAISEVRAIALGQANRPQVRIGAVVEIPAARATNINAPILDALPVRPEEEIRPITRPAAAVSVVETEFRVESLYRRWSRIVPPDQDALRWKEVYLEQYLVPASPRDFLTCLTAIALFLLTCLGMAYAQSAAIGVQQDLGKAIAPWVRGAGTALALVVTMITAISAASRVSRERERQTLDAILMLPEEPETILFAKWLGAFLSVRWCLWGFALIWGMGVLSGGLHPAAVPLLAAAVIVYAAFGASIGLWFSAMNRNTTRATLFTVLVALVMVVGPGLLLRAGQGNIYRPNVYGPVGWMDKFLDYGLTPTLTLTAMAYRSDDLVGSEPPAGSLGPGSLGPLAHPWEQIALGVAGLYLYLALAAGIWLSSRNRLLAARGPRPRRLFVDETVPGRLQTSPSM